MKLLLNLFCLLLLIMVKPVIADTKNIKINIGGVMIDVQAPNGFHEISSLSPETRKLSETMTPPSNRLLAVFVSEEDLGRAMKGELPEFGRYMFLQVLREIENLNVSDKQFQQTATIIKDQQNTILNDLKDKVGVLVEDASGKLSKDYDLSLSIKLGEQAPLGVFLDRSGTVGFASLTKYNVNADGEDLDYLMAGGTSLLLVKNKLLYAYVYSEYETQADVNWVRSTSEEWVDSILSSNISSKSSSPYRSSSASGFDWDRVISKAIVGAIVGGLFAFLFGLIQVAKRLFKKSED